MQANTQSVLSTDKFGTRLSDILDEFKLLLADLDSASSWYRATFDGSKEREHQKEVYEDRTERARTAALHVKNTILSLRDDQAQSEGDMSASKDLMLSNARTMVIYQTHNSLAMYGHSRRYVSSDQEHSADVSPTIGPYLDDHESPCAEQPCGADEEDPKLLEVIKDVESICTMLAGHGGLTKSEIITCDWEGPDSRAIVAAAERARRRDWWKRPIRKMLGLG